MEAVRNPEPDSWLFCFFPPWWSKEENGKYALDMRQGSSLAVVWGEILANTKVGGQKPLKFKICLVEENNKSPPKNPNLELLFFKTVIQWLHLICILSFFLVLPWTFWENWPMMVAQSSTLDEFCLWWIFFVAPLLPRKGWMDVAKTHPFRLPAREIFKNTGLLVPWKSNHHSLQVGLGSTLFYSNGLLSSKRKHHFLNGGWLPRCMFDWKFGSMWTDRFSHIWVFPKIVVPQNGWFIMENPIKNGWFGGTIIFGNTHMVHL